MRAALDANILFYAESLSDGARGKASRDIIHTLTPDRIVIPVQAIGELCAAMLRKAKRTPDAVAAMGADWLGRFPSQATTPEVFSDAMAIVRDHRLQIWDSIIVAAASAAGARILLSEDMQSGFRWHNVMIVNPFNFEPDSILAFLNATQHH